MQEGPEGSGYWGYGFPTRDRWKTSDTVKDCEYQDTTIVEIPFTRDIVDRLPVLKFAPRPKPKSDEKLGLGSGDLDTHYHDPDELAAYNQAPTLDLAAYAEEHYLIKNPARKNKRDDISTEP